GRKTSGLKLPVQLDPRGRATAVLGIGLNVNLEISELPGELRGLATSLRIVSGQTFDRAELAEALLGRLEYQLDRLRGEGFGGVLEGWRKYFRMRGRSVRIGGPGLARAIEGKVRGLDEDGALLVDTDQGRERILAGDVTLLQPEV
ncbi:MAG: biotin--[acetyl-CoA-carboxylase] ligase, partial [Myxococcota bacterium]